MSYRVALMVNGLQVPKPVREIIEWARRHSSIQLAAILVDPSPIDRSGRSCTPMAGVLLRLLAAIERELVLRQSQEKEHVALHSIADAAEVLPISPEGSEAELGRIADLNLDLIVYCGRGGAPSEILSLARDGAITIQYGDCADGLPAFREVLEGRQLTSFAVQRRNGSARETLFRGSISTKLFYLENCVALYDRSTPYLLSSIERLARGEAEVEPALLKDATTCKPVTAGDVISYASRTLGRVIGKQWRHVVGREWNWGVAYSFAPWQSVDLRSGQILPKLPGTFVADPFAVIAEGKHYIFVEEFPYSTRKGVISVYEVDEGGAKRLGVAIEEPYHLSFPFVFRKDNSFYMVPEAQGGGEMVLYECTDFPLRWARKKMIMSEVCADTMIFEHRSSWWMLTTIKGKGSAENSAELHAFYADDPLGDWKPHRMNPVVMDASKGRNGGFLKDNEGSIYRVAQRANFRTYGDAFAIYRIDELSPHSYRETLVREVNPDFFPNLAGAHHMHSQGRLTVYDFSRDERP